MVKIAFLFPGQGSQSIGMGKDLYDRYTLARNLFDRAEDLLGIPLKRLCFEGPEEELKATDVAQPAILTVSAIAFALLRKHGIAPHLVAGHSLGEYTALYAADVLPFHQVLHLVRARGLAMAYAGTIQRGAMAAVLRLEQQKLEDICRMVTAETNQVVVLANLNAPDQLIISGNPEGVAAACERARAAGAKRCLPLPVSGAFHSPLMKPAKEQLEEALKGVLCRDATVPVVTNVDAQPTTDGNAFAGKLAEQLLAPVRWVETVQVLCDQGVEMFVEVGPGTVLRNLGRKLAPGKTVLNVGDITTLEETVAALGMMAAT